MQAKVQPRGLLLRFDTCEQVHTINPCAGQRLSLLHQRTVWVYLSSLAWVVLLGWEPCPWVNACTYTVCYNSEHCTLFEFMCDWCVFTRSVHVSIVSHWRSSLMNTMEDSIVFPWLVYKITLFNYTLLKLYTYYIIQFVHTHGHTLHNHNACRQTLNVMHPPPPPLLFPIHGYSPPVWFRYVITSAVVVARTLCSVSTGIQRHTLSVCADI